MIDRPWFFLLLLMWNVDFCSTYLNAQAQTNQMDQEACQEEHKVHRRAGDLDSSRNAGPCYELDLAGYFIRYSFMGRTSGRVLYSYVLGPSNARLVNSLSSLRLFKDTYWMQDLRHGSKSTVQAHLQSPVYKIK
jgi:hypothetical protein